MAVRKRYPHYPEKPRRPETSAELARSRTERLREFRELGLAGRRAIRVRIRLVAEAKSRLARDLTYEELDAIIPPIECRSLRARLVRSTITDPEPRP